MSRDYSTLARWRIYDHVAVHGTLAGSAIEPGDEAAAEAAFVDALPAVEPDSDCWDRDQCVTICCDLLRNGTHPFPYGPAIGDDDRTAPSDFDRAWDEAMDLDDVPAISGGAPDDDEPEPFTPSSADWAEYRAHFDRVEPPLYGWE
jgi:hypothetical protein